MPDMDMDFTPVTLRNIGVPLRLAVLNEDLEPTYNVDGSPITKIGYLRFDNNVLAEFESAFGSVSTFVEGIDKIPYNSLRMALAIALDLEPKAGANSIPNDLDGVPDTIAALFVALAIAQGVDPTKAATAYMPTRAAFRQAAAQVAEELGAMLDSIAQGSTPPSDTSTSETNSEPLPTSETLSEDESFPVVGV